MAMVSCPKCGFTQPADQYCASCGIDMKAWKPREKPLLVRLGTNTIFQIVLVTVLVAGTFAYMRETRRSELAARVRAIEIARQAEEVDQQISEAQAPRPRVSNAASTSASQPRAMVPQQPGAAPVAPPAPQPQASANLADSSTSSNYSAEATTAGANAEGKTASTSAQAGAPTSAQITFYEMSRTLTTNLLQNATQVTGDGPVNMGVVTGFEPRLRQQTYRSFDTSNQPLQVNQPALVFKGARDQTSGANIGFTIQINPVALDEAGAQIQVDITRVLKDLGPTGVLEANFTPNETFLVPKGGALVLVGILRRKTPTEAETNFYKSVGSLRILTSPSFIQGQSEAVLVIEAK